MQIRNFGTSAIPQRPLALQSPNTPPPSVAAAPQDSVQLSRAERIGKTMVYSSLPIGILAGAAIGFGTDFGLGMLGGLAVTSIVALSGATIAGAEGCGGGGNLADPANPASPLSPINPLNPASPIHWH